MKVILTGRDLMRVPAVRCAREAGFWGRELGSVGPVSRIHAESLVWMRQ